VPTIQLERTLVKSPPELWDEIGSEEALGRWLSGVRVSSAEPPNRVEWSGPAARGVIELEASGWGTRVMARAETNAAPGGFWERFRAPVDDSNVEHELEALMDGIGSSTLKKA
jgi:hypothetical protein